MSESASDIYRRLSNRVYEIQDEMGGLVHQQEVLDRELARVCNLMEDLEPLISMERAEGYLQSLKGTAKSEVN